MSSDYKKYTFGNLNELERVSNPDRSYYDSRSGNIAHSIIAPVIKQHTADYLTGVSEFKAIVLYVFPRGASIDYTKGENIFSSFLKSAKDERIRVICRIPELHAHLPIPTSDSPSPILDLYPTFCGSSDLRIPDVGEIVRVTFGNINTQTDPIYLGSLKQGNGVPGIVASSKPASSYFGTNVSISSGETSRGRSLEGRIVLGADQYQGTKGLAGGQSFKVRESTGAKLKRVIDEVHALGGIVTSGGGFRGLWENVTPTRSATSLHYLGRAIDLAMYSGMVNPNTDPYVIELEDEKNKLWRVWARASNGTMKTLQAYTIKNNVVEVKGKFIDLTAIMQKHGFNRIPALAIPLQSTGQAEWWHFQDEEGLVKNQTTFGQELQNVWSEKHLIGSGPWMRAEAKWRGTYFT